jgi:RNA polymerase sigma-70 factor (ECF subfamily)
MAGGLSDASAAELTRRLVAGDEKAFSEFHARYFDRLHHFLLVVTHGNEDEAMDALQETLLRVARRPLVFRDEELLWKWLKAVARNAARDGWRKQRRYLALLERFTLHWGGVVTDTAEEDNEARLEDLLCECIGELSSEERQLIDGKYFDGMAVAELSSNAGLTEKAVESRLHRLRVHLREQMIKKLKTL